MIHAPHFDNGKSLCGADYSLDYVGQKPTCPACIELQMEIAEEMAEFETINKDYYAAIGEAIQAALCNNNAEIYLQRAEQIRAELHEQQTLAA